MAMTEVSTKKKIDSFCSPSFVNRWLEVQVLSSAAPSLYYEFTLPTVIEPKVARWPGGQATDCKPSRHTVRAFRKFHCPSSRRKPA